MTGEGENMPGRVLSEESADEFWARLLGDDDPCALGKDWSDRVVFVQEEADRG